MKIFLDAMGGDNAPRATVEAALEALQKFPSLLLELGGPLQAVKDMVSQVFDGVSESLKSRLILTDCPELIENCEAPAFAIRKKTKSAIVMGMLKLRDQEANAFVSAGSTGAVLLGGMLRLGRILGIDRPALAPMMPNGKGFFLLIDSGANVDCRPEWLRQFAIMGKAYLQSVHGLGNPRIGLVNNGAEAEKGCALTREAYTLLESDSNLNFIGNVEARDITGDIADVIVCDGFVGNIILKFMEGLAPTLIGIIKSEIMSDTRSKLGGLLAKPAFKRVSAILDYNEVGGAPLLGVQGNVIKAHGSSNGHALACAISQAVKMIEGDVVGKITSNLVCTEVISE